MKLIRNTFMELYMPYCVKKVDDKYGGWVPLNRGYSLLGTDKRDGDRWQECPVSSRISYIPALTLHQLSHQKIDANPSGVWLYDGSTNPLNSPELAEAYFKRVELLLSLETGMFSVNNVDATYTEFGNWLVNTAFEDGPCSDLKEDFICDCRTSLLHPAEIIRPKDLFYRMSMQSASQVSMQALAEAARLWGAPIDDLIDEDA